MMAYPKSKFLAMAAFDTVASLLTFIPAAFISGDLMVLLLQVVIAQLCRYLLHFSVFSSSEVFLVGQ
jgi:hypothetical protein